MKTITANGGGFLLSSITYHPSGMPNVITHSSGGSMIETITQASHGMARPSSITITAPNDMTPFATGTYAYDAAGNIKTMGTDHFRYDKYSRLVEAQMQSISPARTQSYGFDAYGNMTSVATTSGPTEIFQVIGTSNRITLPAPVALAQYDASGNLTSWSDPSTTSTYTWDRFNRMTHWGNGAEGWSYVYTADDERLWAIKDVAGATYSNWTFRGLGNEVLVRDERRPSPTPRALTQYAYREGKLLVSLKVGGAFRDHGLDHLGSVRATAEFSLGTLGVRHTYFPFGREATSTAQDTEVMKFTGHERDLQSTPTSTADDLDYMHARYRSPLTSRFISIDPILGNQKRPQSWNRYAYVQGNPLILLDPNGKKAKKFDPKKDKSRTIHPGTDTPVDPGKKPEEQSTVYNCHSAAWHGGKGDPSDSRNRKLPPKWDDSPDDDMNEAIGLDPNDANRPGDIVVYGMDMDFDGVLTGGEIRHSALVTDVDREGNTLRVESKEGRGPVTDHHPLDQNPRYGNDLQWFRPRGGSNR